MSIALEMPMSRLVFAAILAVSPLVAVAADCRVSGTAYNIIGKPMRAVVRLTNVDSGRSVFGATDAKAAFSLDASGNGNFRLDLISAPTRVTGSHLRTRSILGQSPRFSCGRDVVVQQDVREQAE
jgi:hypothetical protein